MTNTQIIDGIPMPSTDHVIAVTEQISAWSQWTLFLAMFVLWLLCSAFAVRFMVYKLTESNERLLKAKEDESLLIRQLHQEKTQLSADYANRLEQLVKDSIKAQRDLADACNRLADKIDHNHARS